MATNKIRNAVIIGFIFVFMNLGFLWCINETTNLFFVDNFLDGFSYVAFAIPLFYLFFIWSYTESEVPDFGLFNSLVLTVIPVFFVAFIYFLLLSDNKINTTLKNEILASMDETEQKVFKERYSLGRFGFCICNKDDYSSQRCIDYLNDIIDDTKKKAQKLKNKEEFEKFEQKQEQEREREREYKMRALIQKLDI